MQNLQIQRESESVPILEGKPFIDELEMSDRLKFVSKVFKIVFIQLCVTFGSVTLTTSSPSVNQFYLSGASNGLVALSGIALMGSTFTLVCCSHLTKVHPHNMVLLSMYTFAQTVLMSFITAQMQSNVVLLALTATLLIVGTLGVVATSNVVDLTGKGPYFSIAILVLIAFGFLSLFVNNNGFQLVYALFGVILFSCFLIYDIQLIIGGNHKFRYEVDDHVTAALMLYMDIIQIFLYLLRLFSENSQSS